MNKNVINRLNKIKSEATNHTKSPDNLINGVIKVCNHQFDIHELYNKLGFISYSDAVDLLRDNVIAANRQHDLADAECFREQERSINCLNQYFVETIHGCHIAPTVHPVTYRDVVRLINVIKHKG